ncbi:hypothetical protein HYH03_005299 [Edaphochlamys debaryana]|uniref:Uncharacterized protein n=1 Tax=Edaphochlamys debaryana TaxID=47281 RepID=A0A835Y5P4_9CHLO|nr:hypothetical protein HYH03_005299 [Edaphochlamys debaryana]|eukprot:KAG2496473.1 hypothetical protein HYH03_005299 [Edaphochlamys debaryana]
MGRAVRCGGTAVLGDARASQHSAAPAQTATSGAAERLAQTRRDLEAAVREVSGARQRVAQAWQRLEASAAAQALQQLGHKAATAAASTPARSSDSAVPLAPKMGAEVKLGRRTKAKAGTPPTPPLAPPPADLAAPPQEREAPVGAVAGPLRQLADFWEQQSRQVQQLRQEVAALKAQGAREAQGLRAENARLASELEKLRLVVDENHKFATMTAGNFGDFHGRVAEFMVQQGLPPELQGCHNVHVRSGADLDGFMGEGTAEAVLRGLLSSLQDRCAVACTVLRLVHRGLVGDEPAAPEAAALQALIDRMEAPGPLRPPFEEMLPLLDAARPSFVARDPLYPETRWAKLRELAALLCGADLAPGASGDGAKAFAGGPAPLLALHLLAAGKEQDKLEVDLARWTPAHGPHAAELVALEVKTSLKVNDAVRQLETPLRVLWLAHILASRGGAQQAAGAALGDEARRGGSEGEGEELRITAGVCGVKPRAPGSTALSELSLQLTVGGWELSRQVPVPVYVLGPHGRVVQLGGTSTGKQPGLGLGVEPRDPN